MPLRTEGDLKRLDKETHTRMNSESQPLRAITMIATDRPTSADKEATETDEQDQSNVEIVHVQIHSAQQVEPTNEIQRPCIVRLKKILHSASFSQTMKCITAMLAFATSITYCVTTYYVPFEVWYQILDTCVCVIFLTELIYRLGLSANCFRFFFHTQTLIDILIILPPLIFYREGGADPKNSYFHFLLVLSQLIRILNAINFIEKFVFKCGDTDVSRQILSIILIVVELIYIFAGLLHSLETEVQPEGSNQFHAMIYFVWVTISTVGYGDISPRTTEGRLILTVLITIILLLIPKKTGELVQIISKQSFYARNLYKSKVDVPHLVVAGQVRVQELRSFCYELLHQDHGNQDKNAVILQPQHPSIQMEMFLRLTKNEFYLFYLQGKATNDRDLKRADLKHARAGVLLTDKQAKDQVAMDQRNILTGLAMKKYVEENSTNIPPHERHAFNLCIQLIRPESKNHYLSSLSPGTPLTDHLIIVEEIKMNLMAKSCYAPGIIAMISNLVSSSGDPPHQEATWLNEYTIGMGHEIYRVSLSTALENNTFREVCEIVYNEVNGIVFALELEIGGKMVIRLNPSNFFINNVIENNIHVYIICENKQQADIVETLNMSSEEVAEKQELEKKRDARHQRNSRQNNRLQPYKVYSHTGGSPHDIPVPGRIRDGIQNSAYINETEKGLMEDPEYASMDISHRVRHKNLYTKTHGQQTIDAKYNIADQSRDNALFRMNGRSEDDYWVTHKQDEKEQKQPNLENSLKVMNHIIVLGMHDSLVHFLLPLRSKHLKTIQPIVILSSTQSNKVINTLLRFPKVYFVKGSPLTRDGLLKANIHYASKCVILGSIEQQENFSNEMLDAESIFIYKTIRSLNPSVKIVTELVYHSNIDLLYDNDEICQILSQKISNGDKKNGAIQQLNSSDAFELSPLFAAGDVYISSFIDTLTAQAFFNPQIVTIVQQVLTGHSDHQQKIVNADPDLIQSNLWQVHVPENCVNQDFQFLFQHLLNQDLLILGLYRLPGATDNNYPYVYTNPHPGTKITARDKVFVLGLNIPDPIAYEGRQLLKNSTQEPGRKYSYKHYKAQSPQQPRFSVHEGSERGRVAQLNIQDGRIHTENLETEERQNMSSFEINPPHKFEGRGRNSTAQLEAGSVSQESRDQKPLFILNHKKQRQSGKLLDYEERKNSESESSDNWMDEEPQTATQMAMKELNQMYKRLKREMQQLETVMDYNEEEISRIIKHSIN